MTVWRSNGFRNPLNWQQLSRSHELAPGLAPLMPVNFSEINWGNILQTSLNREKNRHNPGQRKPFDTEFEVFFGRSMQSTAAVF